MPVRPFFDPEPGDVTAFVESVPGWSGDDDPTFWSESRLAARRDELLRRQVEWLAEGSAFYRRRFAEHGIEAGDIAGTADLAGVPVTTKQELMDDPDAFRLAFDAPSLYDLTYATVYTTGTTAGVPTRYDYTTHDFFGVLLAGRRQMKMHLIVPGELMFSAFPLSPLPHVSGFGGPIANASGLGFAHGFSGFPYEEFPIHHDTSHLIDEIEAMRPASVIGIGSFLRRMFAEAADQGRDLSSIVSVLASGEILTTRMLQHMRANLERCGAQDPMIAAPYGFTEGAISFAQCYEGGPLQSSAPDQLFVEILDADTLTPVADGEVGLVAITHLNRRGMPLLRYLVGDRGAISNARCAHTGRVGQAMLVSSGSAHISRTNDLVKIKGTLVNPNVIHDVLMNTPGILEYQAIVARRDPDDELSPDRLQIRVAVEPEHHAEWGTSGTRSSDLADRVRATTEVTPEVVLVDDPSEIYDPTTQFKAQRLVDLRSLPNR